MLKIARDIIQTFDKDKIEKHAWTLEPIRIQRIAEIIDKEFPHRIQCNIKLIIRDLEVILDADFKGGISGAFNVSQKGNIVAPLILIDSSSLTINGRLNKCWKRMISIKELLHYAFFRRHYMANDKIFVDNPQDIKKNIEDLRAKDHALACLECLQDKTIDPALKNEYEALIMAIEIMLPSSIRYFFESKFSEERGLWHEFLAITFQIPKSLVETVSHTDYLNLIMKEDNNMNIYNLHYFKNQKLLTDNQKKIINSYETFKVSQKQIEEIFLKNDIKQNV